MRNFLIIFLCLLLVLSCVLTFFCYSRLSKNEITLGGGYRYTVDISPNVGIGVSNPVVYNKIGNYLLASQGYSVGHYPNAVGAIHYIVEYNGTWEEYFAQFGNLAVTVSQAYIEPGGIGAIFRENNDVDFSFLIPVVSNVLIYNNEVSFSNSLSYEWGSKSVLTALASVFEINFNRMPVLNPSDILGVVRGVFVDYPEWVLSFANDLIFFVGGVRI